MIRRAILAMMASALAAAAQSPPPPAGHDLLRSLDVVLERGDRAPTIDELLGDAVDRLRAVDGMSARAAAGRLRETEAEIRLCESLLRQVRAGVLVAFPGPARPAAVPAPADLAAERLKVEQLEAQLRGAEQDLLARSSGVERAPAPHVRPTAISDAMLDVAVVVPEPPQGRSARDAADPSNLSRALFAAGDFPGTLEALEQVPAEKRTAEHGLRRARALDHLGRAGEARSAYEAVVASDKEGPFGRQAAWMLKLFRTREHVAGAMAKTETRPGRARGEKKE